MKKLNNKQIVELLKSGDFTIAYHDNECASLYIGKHQYDDLKEEDEVSLSNCIEDGYIPLEVNLLVQALKGQVQTI